MGYIQQVLGTLQRQFFCADKLMKETAVNLKHIYKSNPQGEGGKPYTTYRTHIHRRDPHPQGGGATIQYLQQPHPQGGRENHDHLHE